MESILDFVAGAFHWLAFLGIIVAGYDYYLTRKRASLLWGVVFLVGWLLPKYSMHLLLMVKTPLVRYLIPNNLGGLIVGTLLTAGPWLYFVPRLVRSNRRRRS